MKEILPDIMIAEATTSDKMLAADSFRVDVQRHYLAIFKKHNTNRDQFFKSMNYYSRHPEILEKDMQQVVDTLNTMEARTH